MAELLNKKGNEAKSLVIAIDSNGKIVERMEGFRLRIIAHHDDNPTVADLLHPAPRDTEMVQAALDNWAQAFNIQTPIACMAYLPGLHNLSRKLRHKTELPLLKKTARQVFIYL